MTTPIGTHPGSHHTAADEGVEMPRPTARPIVLSVAIMLMSAGLATNLLLSVVGLVLFIYGLSGWIRQMLPGQGHAHEPLVEARPQAIIPRPGTVEQLRPGMPGHRFRVPEKVHPISSGVKGGIVGGVAMAIPALAYGVVSGHGIWFPINLLAGMVVQGISGASEEQLEHFYLGAVVLALVIHAAFSVGFGLFFGVVSPTLPPIPGGPVVAGGVLMPLIWSGLCYACLGIVNPLLEKHVNWPWFIASQVVYGLAMSLVVVNTQKVYVAQPGPGPHPPAGAPATGPEGGQP